MNASEHIVVVDLIVNADGGIICDSCSDPIARGDLIAVLSNGERVHEDACRPLVGSTAADDQEGAGGW